jgi:chromosome segregation protein
MKLTALRLHGFKSFADRTEIQFHDGITAIVGPNGCGKSNISDAIRWVLGEQRPTAIRGAKMEEAIFQGTVNRRPVNRGSVTMEISNPAGLLPVPFEEVEISRTVYRDGGSEYRLNRSACRLRDIQDLCRDTGLGANAYAVIEGRMIDAILSDRAEERRSLFEEAAGIGKYKDRRKAAVRRLERAEIDLQRLEDLIGEVQSKVRSLARQKGRAERYRELRKRRLDVEVTVVRSRLDAFAARLREVRSVLDGGLEAGESLQAQITLAEARVEALRVEQVEAERARGTAAARVEEVRSELVEWEREMAVAAERAAYAERRLDQIGGERDEARARGAQAASEAGELEARETERREALERLRRDVEAGRTRAEEVRERLQQARAEMDEVEAREREVARRSAQLQGDAEAADSQAAELALRLEHLAAELEEAREGLAEIRSQGDLFGDRLEGVEAEVVGAREVRDAADERVGAARTAVETAREEELAAEDRAGGLETRLATLETMEREREGMDPVLKALLADPPAGVVGILADSISAEPEIVAAVESYLGVTSRGVVVRDGPAADRVAAWFREKWTGGGGLVILPLDRVTGSTFSGPLLDRVNAHGEGAPWVGALLDGVEYWADEGLRSGKGGTHRARDGVAADGTAQTRLGLLRVGNPLGATGLLERKEELRGLRHEAAGARKRADELREARIEARAELQAAEEALEEARVTLREAEDRHREARAREAERSHRRRRVERAIEELERQEEGARTARTRALDRSSTALAELASLSGEAEELRAGRIEARGALDVVQEEWETVRARVSELTVEEARAEGELERLAERRQELGKIALAGERRVGELDREEAELRGELERVGELRGRGEEETRRLFELRDEARSRLDERDAALEGLQEALREAEKRVREARSAEREASDRRHRLELEAQELQGRIGRIQDRLEGEWGRPLRTLLEEADPVEGEREELEGELRRIVERLEGLGPVNMLAVEEHEEESARLSFLQEQREDLVEARDGLRSAIREINQTATRLFDETFQGIRENFRDTFQRLFQGGECDVWLEDPDDPLESAIEIHASPKGKRTQRIDLLSGGERALTALSLLFGIYLVKPSPFCVLDEVDAPLDESNIGRFIRLLQEFKHQTQFVVITHNPRTIEAADWIYGVTMEEPGVSSIVGVRLEDALETAGV